MSTSTKGESSEAASVEINLRCRKIFLENTFFKPQEKVQMTTKNIYIQEDPTVNKNSIRIISKQAVLKVFAHFGDVRPTLIFYIRRRSKIATVFYKMILFPVSISSEQKAFLYDLFGSIDEISEVEAKKALKNVSSRSINATEAPTSSVSGNPSEERPVLIYPEGRGGITIYKADYMRLADEELLNDIIIDFYLQYLFKNVLTPSLRERTHIFSTHFYTRLTDTTTVTYGGLSRAQQRHASVQNWTRKINLFEKDFIVIPINKDDHWIVAIICYPSLADESVESKGICEPAQGTSSDMDDASADSNQPIKRPLILMFDSLENSHLKEFKILREYLTYEHMAKKLGSKFFNTTTIKGHSPKIPRQNNLTDCGVYVLLYIEKFFKETAMDLSPPITKWTHWFTASDAKKKRGDIAVSLRTLSWIYNPATEHTLPHISAG